MDGGRSGVSPLSALRRLLRDLRTPSRLCANPLAARISCSDAPRLAESIDWALGVSLYRLPARQRAIVVRYDLRRESVTAICKVLGLSRRQFFRDHKAALLRLASLLLSSRAARSASALPTCRVGSGSDSSSLASVTWSLAAGLLSVGAYAQALDLFTDGSRRGNRADRQIASALNAAEIAIESGRATDAQAMLERIGVLPSNRIFQLHPRLAAHYALVAGHLEESHSKRQESYLRAVAIIERPMLHGEGEAANGTLLARTLHALSLSYDHQGDWIAARDAASKAVDTVKHFLLEDTPIGLVVRANYAMRDARHYGNVDLPLKTLRQCLQLALRNGWMPVIGDLAVQFINLNLMRLDYIQALAWSQWISAAEVSRFAARTRNFLAVDSAHALTMLGHPDRALAFLQDSSSDEGLAFTGAREYWHADALRAAGDIEASLILGSHALDRAASAGSPKGQARCKRLLATCHFALGRAGLARRTITECIELSEQFVSPYDLLLSIIAARRFDRRYDRDEARLFRLLHARGSDANFDPPCYE